MARIVFIVLPVMICLFFGSFQFLYSQSSDILILPEPQTEGGTSLMHALKERRSQRAFSAEKLPVQTVSNLLWAAWGFNRPESKKRTAPSASNRQEIEVYAATDSCLYIYDAETHGLRLVFSKDIRAQIGRQSFIKKAPLTFIYVADHTKMQKVRPDLRNYLSAANTGFIAQNVYLYCASEGLATVVFHNIYKQKLAEVLQLNELQYITLAQSVGYPDK